MSDNQKSNTYCMARGSTGALCHARIPITEQFCSLHKPIGIKRCPHGKANPGNCGICRGNMATFENLDRPREGDWFQTFTGQKFYPLDPAPDEIFIEDIAHSLSQLCRFVGHCREFYSVAQHSVLGARALLSSSPFMAYHFLMHDAQEAYLCDLPCPLKHHSDFGIIYTKYEDRMEKVIALKFGLNNPMPPEIKEMDSRLLMTEKRDLLANPPATWRESEKDYPPLKDKIVPWTQKRAEAEFLTLFGDRRFE